MRVKPIRKFARNPGIAETPDMCDEGENLGRLPNETQVSTGLRMSDKQVGRHCTLSLAGGTNLEPQFASYTWGIY